jgi:hypothetical protein
MKRFAKVNRSSAMFIAALTCLVLAASVSAFAVPSGQVHRSLTNVTLTGACCQDIPGETVTVTEPTTVTPIVINWSFQYLATGPFGFGVRVNGGGCGNFGPTFAPATGSPVTQSIQWVIFPNEGLVPGKNTLTVCFGPILKNSDTLAVGPRALAVRIGK